MLSYCCRVGGPTSPTEEGSRHPPLAVPQSPAMRGTLGAAWEELQAAVRVALEGEIARAQALELENRELMQVGPHLGPTAPNRPRPRLRPQVDTLQRERLGILWRPW
jgi:hypothetical protein